MAPILEDKAQPLYDFTPGLVETQVASPTTLEMARMLVSKTVKDSKMLCLFKELPLLLRVICAVLFITVDINYR